jgi:hypothetical protein
MRGPGTIPLYVQAWTFTPGVTSQSALLLVSSKIFTPFSSRGCSGMFPFPSVFTGKALTPFSCIASIASAVWRGVGAATGGIVPPVTEFATGTAPGAAPGAVVAVVSDADATGLHATTAAEAIVASVPLRRKARREPRSARNGRAPRDSSREFWFVGSRSDIAVLRRGAASIHSSEGTPLPESTER